MSKQGGLAFFVVVFNNKEQERGNINRKKFFINAYESQQTKMDSNTNAVAEIK